jgi:hypothetical protein
VVQLSFPGSSPAPVLRTLAGSLRRLHEALGEASQRLSVSTQDRFLAPQQLCEPPHEQCEAPQQEGEPPHQLFAVFWRVSVLSLEKSVSKWDTGSLRLRVSTVNFQPGGAWPSATGPVPCGPVIPFAIRQAGRHHHIYSHSKCSLWRITFYAASSVRIGCGHMKQFIMVPMVLSACRRAFLASPRAKFEVGETVIAFCA